MNQGAGFWIRLGANLLDGIIVAVPLTILSLLITGGEGKEWFTNLLSFLYSLLVPVFWKGFTIGKRICGIRIRRFDDDQPPTIWNMLLRVLIAGIIYGITFGVGILVSAIMVAVREDRRAIHDFIAGTEVIYD
ncbi:RDD family protein [Paenibacillus sp. N4]|uniref:RDD family protein n=1 Tax=Paenibacillus vietnamensis TaxID=2590547 RepID=UPI001CD0A2E9|nr:RDD family protein [Paenibacillus vietnamensis]MCA0754307.1 RDD family protein [Paenibacillus vietnamensis]